MIGSAPNSGHRPGGRSRLGTGVATVLVMAVAVAGCGGSSNKPSSTSSSGSARTSTTARTGATGPRDRFGGFNPQRRAAIAACLRRQGVAFPTRTPGGFRSANSPFRNPAFRAKFQAAASKCGLVVRNGPLGPAFRAAIQRFAGCVRQNGFPLPNPNPTGPPYRTGQFNRNDPRFLAAAGKCRSLLPRGGPGAPGAPGGPGG